MLRVTVAVGLLLGAFVVLGVRWYETSRLAPGDVRAQGSRPEDYRIEHEPIPLAPPTVSAPKPRPCSGDPNPGAKVLP